MLSKSKVAVICLFLTMVFSIGFSAWSEEPDENTVLWFTFDEEFKGEVEDVSGKGNNGAVGSGVKWLDEGKIGGGCAELVGTGGFTVPLLDIKDAITLEIFFQSANLPQGTHRQVINRGWFDNGTYLLWIDNEWADMCISWSVETAARREVRPNGVVKPGEWQYVAATYDGEKMELFLDGESIGEMAQAGDLTGGDVIIGGNFIGLIDEVRISNVVRDVSEIRAHMEGEAEAINPNLGLSTTWGMLKSEWSDR